MKQYKTPRIRLIKIDPNQAVLHVCKAGGLYLYQTDTANIWCSTAARGDSFGPDCNYTPKGGAGGETFMEYNATFCDSKQNLPS